MKKSVFLSTLMNIRTTDQESGVPEYFYIEFFLGAVITFLMVLASGLTLLVFVNLISPVNPEISEVILINTLKSDLLLISLCLVAYSIYMKLINSTVSEEQYEWMKRVYVRLGMPLPTRCMTKVTLLSYVYRASSFYSDEKKKAIDKVNAQVRMS